MNFINFNILEVGFLERKGETHEQVKTRAHHVISCRLSGKGTFCTEDGDILHANKWDILYIPKGSDYTQYTYGEKIIYIHLEIQGKTENKIQLITSEETDYVCNTFRKIKDIWNSKSNNYMYLCTSLLYELVARTNIMLPKEVGKYNRLLAPALRYIDECFANPDFSFEKACALCNISRVYFNRLFKKEFKTTPTLYLNSLKIEKAKILLESGLYSRDEISYLCGFNDTKYFFVVFKKITGCTAGQYQKNVYGNK